MLVVLWCSGVVSFWLGACLAEINGYPVQVLPSAGIAVAVAAGQALLLWRLRWGREVLGGLALGLAPLYLGFFSQSGHWVSEVWILGLLVSLAAGNTLLVQKWQREWQHLLTGRPDQRLGGSSRALVFTLVNIVLISGLIFIWYFPATPLPGRDGAWILAAAGVLNQELIKRKYYHTFQGSAFLSWSVTGFGLGFNVWLLLVMALRAAA